MSNGGFFKVYRKIWENSMLKDEPFNKGYAWLWLVSEASYDASDRGQVVVSQRQLAKTFQWSNTRVWRFLDLLKQSGMIKIANKSGRGATCGAKSGATSSLSIDPRSMVITICNYSKYQDQVAKSHDQNLAKAEQLAERKAEHTLRKKLLPSLRSVEAKEAAQPSATPLDAAALAPRKKTPEEISPAELAERQAHKDAQVAKWENWKRARTDETLQ